MGSARASNTQRGRGVSAGGGMGAHTARAQTRAQGAWARAGALPRLERQARATALLAAASPWQGMDAPDEM